MYDRYVDVPREQAWFGDAEPAAEPFTPELGSVRGELEALTHVRFAYVLLNRYRDGRDSVAWHNDRELTGLPEPVIASLTLGATRAFDLRRKGERSRIVLRRSRSRRPHRDARPNAAQLRAPYREGRSDRGASESI